MVVHEHDEDKISEEVKSIVASLNTFAAKFHHCYAYTKIILTGMLKESFYSTCDLLQDRKLRNEFQLIQYFSSSQVS